MPASPVVRSARSRIVGELKDGERVFDERRSLVLQNPQVVRFSDRERQVLVYVAYSDRVIEGEPERTASAPVPVIGRRHRNMDIPPDLTECLRFAMPWLPAKGTKRTSRPDG